MTKTIIILILILIIILAGFLFLLRENSYCNEIKGMREEYKQNQVRHLENMGKFIQSYEDLDKDYQELYLGYKKLSESINNEPESKWSEFEITAYTSMECGDITSTGVNLKDRWVKNFNIAAVDPRVIKYGSIILIDFNGVIKPFLAADCGAAIKGQKIDLYFTDRQEALNFGRQKLLVKIIN